MVPEHVATRPGRTSRFSRHVDQVPLNEHRILPRKTAGSSVGWNLIEKTEEAELDFVPVATATRLKTFAKDLCRLRRDSAQKFANGNARSVVSNDRAPS
jgi:hypothetical protein